jgi:hypothetical protein
MKIKIIHRVIILYSKWLIKLVKILLKKKILKGVDLLCSLIIRKLCIKIGGIN